MERDELVFMAKLAEQTERYDEVSSTHFMPKRPRNKHCHTLLDADGRADEARRKA